jgi:LysM repeat protein
MLIRLPILSAGSVAVLAWFRPTSVSLENGEDLALAGAWMVALALALWLLVVSSCCAVAMRRGRVGVARRCATLMPAFMRRSLELAIFTSAVVASAVPAHAITDEPVVRTPHAAATPTTTTRPSTTPPTTEAPAPPSTSEQPAPTTARPTTTSTPPEPPKPEPAPVVDVLDPPVDTSQPASARPSPVGDTYVVRPGDNLWLIAQRTLEQRERPTAELVAYWHALIEANMDTLHSGDPNLIYPGEVLTLPAFGDNP